MPTVSVPRDVLHEQIGRILSVDAFDELCFEIGIELDDVTTEKAIIRKQNHLVEEDGNEDEEVIYKIEVPANRADLLCAEGISRAIRVFLGTEKAPLFTVSDPSSVIEMTVKLETAVIRPFVVCAILRGLALDEEKYKSLIDLQDKLHQNLCRKRSLVAIGTHDLDTLEPPFTYEGLPPSEIKFVPLKQTREFTAAELMEFYKADIKLKKFLPIIESSPVFPVIYDKNRTVLSLPPIINGAHSAIRLETKNVFIECTATDLTKAKIVLNTIVTMFSEYCTNKFEVEPVIVVDPSGKRTKYPDLSPRTLEVDLSYITSSIGVKLEAPKVVDLLSRMQLTSQEVDGTNGEKLMVSVPPTRSDVLHPCDVMEDVAIAYGYNNIPKTTPNTCTQGMQQPLNEFSDSIRRELAMAGFTEVLNWILLSGKENSSLLNKNDSKTVIISNPRSSDFEVLRTSLLPGMLKVLEHNKDVSLPLKIFEVSDVVQLDPAKEVGASNIRHLAALHCNTITAFEVIHGLLDGLMTKLNIPQSKTDGYYMTPSDEPEFFKGRQAKILHKESCVGILGVVHPLVLKNFHISDPCSYIELNLETLLKI